MKRWKPAYLSWCNNYTMLMCISLAHEAKQVPSHFKAQKLPRMKIQAHGLVQIMIPWWHRWPSPCQLGHLQYGMAWIGRPAVNGLVQYADTFMETFQHFQSCCPYLKIYIDNFINALYIWMHSFQIRKLGTGRYTAHEYYPSKVLKNKYFLMN